MNFTPVAQNSQRKRSIQPVCMCLVTMTAFLGAGIRPVIGNQRGSGATPKSTLLTLKGFPLQEPKSHLGSPSLLLCQKQCLRVVWRISTQRRCDKNVSILALTRMCFFFYVGNNGTRSNSASETFVYCVHKCQIPGLQRVFAKVADEHT